MNNDLKEVLLFVKSGADGKRYGACPFCQRIFMILMIKSNAKLLKFKVATVNLVKVPEQFKKLGLRRLPAITCGDECFEIVDEIVQFLDAEFPSHELLNYHNIEAEKAVKNVFSKFCFFVKEVTKDGNQLETELKSLNDYLKSCQTTYLTSDHLSHLDCEFLPKLQHVRIACKALKNLEFDPQLQNMWIYLKNAYSNEIFNKACPSDQEIILHWTDKPETPKLTLEQHTQMSKASPVFTKSIPEMTM